MSVLAKKMVIGASRRRGGGGLLDKYPPDHAWGLVHIVSSYTGPVIRVQRTTPDTTEQDFLPEEITDGTLLSFCGAGNGLVAREYDIAGGGQDQVQADPAKMLKIVVGGVLQTRGGLPALVYDAPDVGVVANINLNVGQHLSLFSVFQTTDSAAVHYWGNNTSRWVFIMQQGSGDTSISDRFTILSIAKDGVNQSLSTRGDWYTAFSTGSKVLSYLRGEIFQDAWTAFGLNGYSGFSMENFSQLDLMYLTDQSANQTAIEAIINSIYP